MEDGWDFADAVAEEEALDWICLPYHGEESELSPSPGWFQEALGAAAPVLGLKKQTTKWLSKGPKLLLVACISNTPKFRLLEEVGLMGVELPVVPLRGALDAKELGTICEESLRADEKEAKPLVTTGC